MELPTRFTPQDFEKSIYQQWIESGAFAPGPRKEGEKTFTIMIPPPNVTGVLHMGHALNGAIQDIIIRQRRMQGWTALWVPGTDHAGIATQAVVERKLYEEEKKTRNDLGREAFLARVWAWKEQHGSYILEQYRRLGASCDWSRTQFTMDPGLSRAVREGFVRLFEKGLVYRGARLVNWDCVLETAVSDDEIEYVPRKDKLYEIRYPVKGRPGTFVTVATTRPETMLGDTGVVVHPEDERYRELHGATLLLPFVEREIPLVLDETVEQDFGTGAVKVTPGHDPADYERGARFKLPIVNLYDKKGVLNENGGPFAGLPREKARDAVVKQLEQLGLLGKVEDYTHNVAISDRSKSAIETLVSEQWFVNMKPLAAPAIAAAKSGALKFRPERWQKTYLDWLENVRDWCISRQLWWGHQIPVWYDEDGVPCASRTDLALGSPHPRTKKPIVRRDEDVLDTWASSWLWPFATLGWPDLTPDLERFYPTQFLSTAREIIYLWVARMIMAGYEFMDHLPADQRCAFEVCNVHATVLDAKGKRMSKSAGNGIDPIEMIDKFGADAVRYSLVLLTKEGQDVKLSPERFEDGFRFTNKVWNATRFVLLNMQGARSERPERLEDRWILSRLNATRAVVTEHFEQFRLNDAAKCLYEFVWNDFCDWYVELVKPRMTNASDPSAAAARGTLARVIADALAMLHPFTPYITEVLWKALHETLGEPHGLLISAAWPDGKGLALDETAEADMLVIQNAVSAVRQIRNLTTLGDRTLLEGSVIRAPRDKERRVLEQNQSTLCALAFLANPRIEADPGRPPHSAVGVVGGVEIFVPLPESVDRVKLKGVLEKRVSKVSAGFEALGQKLRNPAFKEGAQSIWQDEQRRWSEMELELNLLKRNAEGF